MWDRLAAGLWRRGISVPDRCTSRQRAAWADGARLRFRIRKPHQVISSARILF